MRDISTCTFKKREGLGFICEDFRAPLFVRFDMHHGGDIFDILSYCVKNLCCFIAEQDYCKTGKE